MRAEEIQLDSADFVVQGNDVTVARVSTISLSGMKGIGLLIISLQFL